MTITRKDSTIFAAVCAAWLAAGAQAIAADDAAQAQICQRTLDAMASGNPEGATDIMLLEGQGPMQVTREGEANLGKMRAATRRIFEGVAQRNGGNPQRRAPMAERRLGAGIVVMERWDYANGAKAYAGCVRFPAKNSGSQNTPQNTWTTNLQVGPDEASVTHKLQQAAAGKPYPAPAK
jgi:hypothetical protein